jgi:AcrR family transcriptional regulator
MSRAGGSTDQTLRLLWRRTLGEPVGSRGPKQRTSVSDVVGEAIALADEKGIAALTMRSLSERLGLHTMSLYTYVPGRDELIGLMIDEVGGEVELPPHDHDLRTRLDRIARHQWDEYRRHPWLLDVESHRPWIGPNASARYEWQLAALDQIGLDDLEMDLAVTLLIGIAASSARAALLADRAQSSSGITDADWWAINAPLLDRVMDPADYPISRRVGTRTGQEYEALSDPARAFEFALARALDGIEIHLARST